MGLSSASSTRRRLTGWALGATPSGAGAALSLASPRVAVK